MKKKLLLIILIAVCSLSSYAQNIIIQQNNQQEQKERVIVKEKEVPVYIKEESTELTQPIVIYGYLYVYPEDLGKFRVGNFPYEAIRNINEANAYGRNTWRLPTEDEFNLMTEVNGGAYHNPDGKLHLDAGFGCVYMRQDSSGRPKKADMNDYYSPDSYQKIRLVSTN